MCKKDKKLLQHIWFLQHIAAALLVAAASGNLAGSIIRLQRYFVQIKEVAFQINRACKITQFCNGLLQHF